MSAQNRYSTVALTLHWILAILLVGMVFFGWQADDARAALLAGDESVTLEEVLFLFNWHKTVGLLVIVLSLGRLGWRLTHPAPPLPDGMKPWERVVAKATHWAFYALMIGLPLGGWLAASTASDADTGLLFNMASLPIPALTGENESLHEIVAFMHSKGAWALLILLGLHVLAGLKHHFVDRDDVLARMVPFLKVKG
ncbi:cytochrome b [Hyphobacterium sp. HN65]|uniref:Cytochrome b n=1 Tax=Hyphobacterium lacteum TaxID=3116575 RepID=A0ABU7LMU0_9PROT|nr:cytochrome b [Hyphobacterium sp. HN65]MEE2525235.1 cytochrome b [Hyphobacterium sp. HN65]